MNIWKIIAVVAVAMSCMGEVCWAQGSLGASNRKNRKATYPWHGDEKAAAVKGDAVQEKKADEVKATDAEKDTRLKRVPSGGAGGVVVLEGTIYGGSPVKKETSGGKVRPRLIMVQPVSETDLEIPTGVGEEAKVEPGVRTQVDGQAVVLTGQRGAVSKKKLSGAVGGGGGSVRAGDSRAMRMLLEVGVGDVAVFRSNAMEALQVVPDRVAPLVRVNLKHENPGVRFAAVVTAGTLKLSELVSAIEPLVNDKDESVKAAALYALHAMGREVNISPLAEMLGEGSQQVRSNVAMLLGMMGDESAIGLLKYLGSRTGARVSEAQSAVMRIQVAEAIAKLGDDSTLSVLRAGAYSRFGEVRVLAISAMGAIGDERMVSALHAFLVPYTEGRGGVREPLEIRLAAAGSIARLGYKRYGHVPAACGLHESPMIRAQAAWVMGWYDDEETAQMLEKMVDDAEPMVRVSAAASLVRRGAR